MVKYIKIMKNIVTSSEQNHALLTFSYFGGPISTAQFILPSIEQENDVDNNYTMIRKAECRLYLDTLTIFSREKNRKREREREINLLGQKIIQWKFEPAIPAIL
jgi:hypothetical protein